MDINRSQDGVVGTAIDATDPGGAVAKVLLPAVQLVDSEGAAVFAAGAIGEPSDAAWDGVAADATVISLLKAIAINTAPA